MKRNQHPIIFFGSATYSVFVLNALRTNGYPLAAVVTQTPRQAGRGKKIRSTAVHLWAKKHNIPVICPLPRKKSPLRIKDIDDLKSQLKNHEAELIVLAAYGQVVPEEVLSLTAHGGLNIHPSLLPDYRGAAPVQWALLNGEKETGVTVIKMSAEIDTGSIVGQQKESVLKNDTSVTLYKRLFIKGSKILVKIIPEYLSGAIKPRLQPKPTTPYARRFTRNDGFIPMEILMKAIQGDKACNLYNRFFPKESKDVTDAVFIERMVRALKPWPGVWTTIRTRNKGLRIKEEKRLKILQAHTQKAQLLPDQVQLEGKKPMDWNEFKKTYGIMLFKN